MRDGQLDHNMLKLISFFVCRCVYVCVCVNKIVNNSEQNIVNNKLLKTILENV